MEILQKPESTLALFIPIEAINDWQKCVTLKLHDLERGSLGG